MPRLLFALALTLALFAPHGSVMMSDPEPDDPPPICHNCGCMVTRHC
jgi:hypothetical protein